MLSVLQHGVDGANRILSLSRTTGLYRENAISVESEASDSLTCYRRVDQSGFARKERTLHCDVHVAAENKHVLPPFGYLDSFWITRSQRSRRRDKGLLTMLQVMAR